jgi:DNA-binding CsgD family transcriptional regulator
MVSAKRGWVMKTSIRIELAEAWLAATRSGKWMDAEAFAEALVEQCRSRIPHLNGILAGAEPEVVQDMCLLLIGSFLQRNRRLAVATRKGDLKEIDHHLRASLKICASLAIRRIARYRERELSRKVEAVTDADLGVVDHPHASRELSPEQRCALALTALQLAMHKDLVTERALEIVRLTLEEGLTGRQVAERLGISPSAVSQQLRRVSAQLNVLKEAVEIVIP